MSNFLAVATVTEALVQTLLGEVTADVSAATITTLRPDGPAAGAQGPRVNIYLFQVTPNAAFRNADLPTRTAEGRSTQRPRAAIDLHYLFTFYGDEAQLEPQRLLGSVVRALHAKPILTRTAIENAKRAKPAILGQSNLADEVEHVKFTPIHLSLEEMARLWSVFFQTQYTLSVAYQGSLVFIEPDEPPRATLPVRKRLIYVEPFHRPLVDRVVSADGEFAPVFADSTIEIHGQQLLGKTTRVRIGDVVYKPTPDDVSDTHITLQLTQPPEPPQPPDALRAGVQALQIVHQMPMGEPEVDHKGVESNGVALVLRPKITIDAQNSGASKVVLSVAPKVGKAQRMALLLNQRAAAAPEAYTFPVAPRSADAKTITIPIGGVKPGDYLVRVQIDGAESVLEVDANNQFVGPMVTIS